MTETHRPGRILIIGYGAIGTAALPLLVDRLPVPPDRITIIDRVDRRRALKPFLDRGVRFEQFTITRDNHAALLGERLGAGDLLIDMAPCIGTLNMLEFCKERGVLLLNSSVERWPGAEGEAPHPDDVLLYPRMWRVCDWIARHGRPGDATAVIDHGANPGLVSHFVKQGLADCAGTILERRPLAARRRGALREALDARAWAALSEALGVRVIQVSELDTQTPAAARPKGEFQSTWSARTMHEEALTLAELCWGTHEGARPAGARTFNDGPRHMICLPTTGVETWVASWTPGGGFPAMVIGHDEAYTIGQHLTVRGRQRLRYRPTVYFAYQPTVPTLDSLRESAQAGGWLQERASVLTEDLASGRDQLGCLLMGHPLKSWWIGSLLSVDEARSLIGPRVNATTVQVSIALAAALEWMLKHPAAGPRLPDDLPHDEILPAARPYLGPFRSHAVDWAPADAVPGSAETWRFEHFLTDASLSSASRLASRAARREPQPLAALADAAERDRRPFA